MPLNVKEFSDLKEFVVETLNTELAGYKLNQLPTVAVVDETHIFLVATKDDGQAYQADKLLMQTAIGVNSFKSATTTTVPTNMKDGDIYFPTQVGTYTNFLGTGGTPLAVTGTEGLVYFIYNGTLFVKVAQAVNMAAYYTKTEIDTKFTDLTNKLLVPGKNLLDVSKVDYTKRYTTGTSSVVARGGTVFVLTPYIPVTEGTTYTFSPTTPFNGGGYFTAAGNTTAVANMTTTVSGTNGRTFTVPTGQGIKFIAFNLTCTDTTGNTLTSAVFQVEIGSSPTSYQAYGLQFNPIYLTDVNNKITANTTNISTNTANINKILISESFNRMNPANFKFDRRYSTGSKAIVAADANPIAFGGLIPVVEGEWYTASGVGLYTVSSSFQGGYFGEGATDAIGQASIANITFVTPVSGTGKAFQVPLGQGIKYATVSIASTDHATINGEAQIEVGEMATAYQPYALVEQINPDLLPEGTGGGGDGGGGNPVTTNVQLEKYTTFGNLIYNGLADKISDFRKHWYAKDKDLVVVNTGTSLTARSTEHCSEHREANMRPPLMGSLNFATHIWDALKWENQQYRRYDYTGFFTETGTWSTQSNLAEWDDGAYRAGLTRYSDDLASTLQFTIPTGAWQFNLIFRADQVSSANCKIVVAEGANKVQVWNGTSWVEANNYIFSQLESPISTIPTVNYTDPITGQPATLSNYQTKGNTTFQKRLKMRCRTDSTWDSTGETKLITISRTSGRLSYWGVEWSKRQWMITYINAARGSHNSLIGTGAVCLNHYADNEVYLFKPDLILTEDPIHNSGGSTVPDNDKPTTYYAQVTENFFFADNAISMKARSAVVNGSPIKEWVIFNSSITKGFNGIDANGLLILGKTLDKRYWSALDSQSSCYVRVTEDHPEVVYINAVKHWVKACVDCYGDMNKATEGSGKNGLTFTNEGSHWNDTGSRVMARCVLPMIDFTTGLTKQYPIQVSVQSSFGTLNGNSFQDLNFVVDGVVDGDVIALGVPNLAMQSGGIYTAWVTSANLVTIRRTNITSSSVNPVFMTFKIRVFKQ